MHVENFDELRDRLYFECPKREAHMCMVLLKPWPIIGCHTWDWDHNEAAPTLSPSVNCGDCGWHGFIKEGKCANA